jgi:hypothetical protein
MGKNMSRGFLLSVAIVLCLVSGAAAENTPLRWAIVGSGGDKAQGIADLLLSRMSAEAVELVERDFVAEIAEEQKLNAMLGAGNAADRANLLSLLKADRLVLLSSHALNNEPSVHTVIAESSHGARLAVRDFPRGNSTETILDEIVALVESTRKQYADGIKAVVGLAPLTPGNLEHDYDYLSTVYRDLIQGELSSLPGVAVIEVDEARAIAGEMAVSNGDVSGRVTPILIDGSYTVSEAGDRVTFSLKASRGKAVLASLNDQVLRKDVASYFKQHVSGTALELDLAESKVSVDEQFNWLVAQAESFSRLAMPARAAGLREAALLLKPDNAKERLALLADYRKSVNSLDPFPPGSTREEIMTLKSQQCVEKVNSYITALHHVEYLIMNRLVDKEQAADLIGKHRSRLLASVFSHSYIIDSDGRPQREGASDLRRAEDAEFTMHRLVLPVLETLPVPSRNRGLGLANFDQYLMLSYLTRADSAGLTARQLEECVYFFSELCPKDRRVSYTIKNFFAEKAPEKSRFATITHDEWVSFLNALSRSKKALVRALAEYGRINLILKAENEMDAAAKAQTVGRIEALMETWNDLPARPRAIRRKEPLYVDLARARVRLAPDRKVVSPTRKLPTKPADWQTNPSTWQYWGYPQMLGHIRFKELDVGMRGESNAKSLPPHLSFVKATSSVDFLWNGAGIWTLDSDLKMSRIAEGVKLPIKKVLWDGKYLWVLSGKDHAAGEHCIVACDAAGKILAGLGADDFSKHDVSMRMIVADEGVACVTGTFKPHNRTWLATVTVDGDSLTPNEFHHAKEMPTSQKGRLDFGNPNLVFVPAWMHMADMGRGKPKVWLMGRSRTTTYERFHPLAVDMDTLKVSVHPYEMGNHNADKNYFSTNGELLHDYGHHVTHWARLGETWSTGKEWKYLCTNMHNADHLGEGFFVHDGYLHVTGRKWVRVNLKTMVEENMTKGVVPRKWRMAWVGSSSNHGIIGYSQDRKLYAVSFAKGHLFLSDEEE